jgi:SAM-dependent methyltransferase
MPQFLKMFRSSGSGAPLVPQSQERVPRRSTGFQEFTKSICTEEGLTVLDLGPTSPTNIQFLTSLGHKVYNVDVLLSSTDPTLLRKTEENGFAVDVERFFAENLVFRGDQFDAVLLWSVADYLPEPLVKPLIERIQNVMKPGGMLLGFFHTKDAGPDAPYQRYHIAGPDVLELQQVPRFRLQRVFNNRHIETLFQNFKSLKFFLSRDHTREVLAVR